MFEERFGLMKNNVLARHIQFSVLVVFLFFSFCSTSKAFDFSKSFAYQLVSADTQILCFDDVKKYFDFERLFSVVTEGLTLEKKNNFSFILSKNGYYCFNPWIYV